MGTARLRLTDLDIDNIVYTIHNCASSGIVVQEWYCLAIALDVDGFKKKELRKRYQEDMLDSYALFDSILKHWRSKENNKATMKLLLEAVEKCEWIDLADKLRESYVAGNWRYGKTNSDTFTFRRRPAYAKDFISQWNSDKFIIVNTESIELTYIRICATVPYSKKMLLEDLLTPKFCKSGNDENTIPVVNVTGRNIELEIKRISNVPRKCFLIRSMT